MPHGRGLRAAQTMNRGTPMHNSSDASPDTSLPVTSPDTSATTSLTPSERAAIDGLLRCELGRRMTVCLLALADTHFDAIMALAERLASIEEIRVLPPSASTALVEEDLPAAA